MNEELVFLQLSQSEPRFPADAYRFVSDSLAYASDSVSLGLEAQEQTGFNELGEPTVEHHFTGQQLCEAFRLYAINQFGHLSHLVMDEWNIRSTSDFGDIVYKMIDAGLMKKSTHDRREDFDNVFEFKTAFEHDLDVGSTTAIF